MKQFTLNMSKVKFNEKGKCEIKVEKGVLKPTPEQLKRCFKEVPRIFKCDRCAFEMLETNPKFTQEHLEEGKPCPDCGFSAKGKIVFKEYLF